MNAKGSREGGAANGVTAVGDLCRWFGALCEMLAPKTTSGGGDIAYSW